MNGRVAWEDRHYRTRTILDGPALDVSLGGSYVITPTVRADVSAGYGRERPERMRERHERYRVGAGVSVILPFGFTVGGGGDYRWTDFEAGWFPHVADGGPRRGPDLERACVGLQPGRHAHGLQPRGIGGARGSQDERTALRLRAHAGGTALRAAVLSGPGMQRTGDGHPVEARGRPVSAPPPP